MYLFNLLYCAGDDKAKLSLLYDIVVNYSHGERKINHKSVKPTDELILKKIEYLIMIPTLLIANIIEQQNKFAIKTSEEKYLH